jgi:hypothetical protein
MTSTTGRSTLSTGTDSTGPFLGESAVREDAYTVGAVEGGKELALY